MDYQQQRKRRSRLSRWRRLRRWRARWYWLLLIIVVLALLAYPFIEPTRLTIEEHTVYVPNLPSNLKNLRIAYATDIHQGRWFSQKRVNELFNTLNGLSADLVLLGGDYANDSDGAIAFFRSCPNLHARLGVYAVLGNHDRTEPESNLGTLTKTMQDRGITPLVNTVTRAKVGQSYVYIAGVDDFYNGFPDVAKVASQVYADDFVIFMGHTPDLMPDVLKARSIDNDNHWFDLALFGHTHGGQVNVLGRSPFSKLSPEAGARYLSGWLEENRAAILVSNGVGTSVAPVRLFAPPQIHLITLKAR